MARYPSEEKDRFIVRMPDGMREKLKEVAAKNNRSVNAEIVARLQDSFEFEDAMLVADEKYAAMKPILDVARREVAESYDTRLASIENILREINERQRTEYYPPQNTKPNKEEGR